MRLRLFLGECAERMRGMPEGSVDAVVCDPPYGLEFMGKAWDKLDWQAGGGFSKPGIGARQTAWPSYSATAMHGAANPTCAVCGGRLRGAKKCSCPQPHEHWKPIGKRRNPENEGLPDTVTSAGMSRHLNAIATWHQAWLAEAFRVLVPGGVVKAFSGTRTYHRLAAAMEEVGFELLAPEAWGYGSGFPKSLNVSKAIDRRRADEIGHVCAFLRAALDARGLTSREVGEHFGLNPRQVDQWAPRPTDNSSLRRAHVPTWDQWERLRMLLGFEEPTMDAEVWRLNGRKGRPGDAWFEREVVGVRDDGAGNGSVVGLGRARSMATVFEETAPATDAARTWEGWGTALKPAWEPVVVGRKPVGCPRTDNPPGGAC